MRRFYELFSDVESIRPQLVDEFETELIFTIPWGHIRNIIDKCSGDTQKALFYIQETVNNNWSRAILLNFLDTNLYERQGKAVTNFEYRLPAEQSGLAQEMTKDPYNFDFLAIQKNYDEKELKDKDYISKIEDISNKLQLDNGENVGDILIKRYLNDIGFKVEEYNKDNSTILEDLLEFMDENRKEANERNKSLEKSDTYLQER